MKKRTTKSSRAEPRRAAAVVTATVDAPLGPAHKRLLADALRRAEETRDTIEDALVNFGRWLLVAVFDDDAAAALEGRRDNPVWRELLGRAGGPTLRLSERTLYVALQIAAHDKRITDEAWRGLEPGRKELLLPLGDEDLMREAAQHVSAMKLTQRATRAYVAGLRAERGEGARLRLTGPRVASQVRSFRARVATAAWQKRALKAAAAADPAVQAAIRDELEALRAWAASMLTRLPTKAGDPPTPEPLEKKSRGRNS